MDISQEVIQNTVQILTPLLPYLLKGGKIIAQKALEEAGKKLTDSSWSLAEKVWGRIKTKADTNLDTKTALEKAAQKPEEKRAVLLESQLEDMFAEDPALAVEIGQIINMGDGIGIGGNVSDANILNDSDQNVLVKENKGTINIFAAPSQEGKSSRKSKKETPAANPSEEEIKADYLNGVISDCKRARLVGLDPKAADITRGAFSLDRLYISLDTKTQTEIKEGKQKEGEPMLSRDRARPLTALEALWRQEEQCMVLLGLPGSGKSTLVRYLSLWHARSLLDSSITVSENLPGWEGSAMIPVIVPLGRLAESLPKSAARGCAQFIEKFIEQTTSAQFMEYLSKHMIEDGALFLFDGLDEVADVELRPIVVESVEQFSAKCKNHRSSRFLVTCRTFSYTDPRWKLTGWAQHELAPLTQKKIEQFVEYWHNECINTDPSREADYQEKRRKLHEALRQGDHRRLWEIADNPLILTVMAVVHTHKGDLPDARALVYEECIDLLLLRWEAERVVTGKSQRRDLRTALNVPEVALKNALQEIAYHAHERKPDGKRENQAALVTEDLLRADLYAAFQDNEKVQTFLDYCESANGLLMLQGVAPLPDSPPDSPPRRVYAFPHLTFEEYLAARYIGRMANLGQKTHDHLVRSDRWREVVMLLGEHVCFKEGNYELMDSMIQALAPATAPAAKDEDWLARWAAGDLLLLYRRAFEHRKTLHAHVQQSLVDLLAQSALSSRERTEAGNTLARLGDPRFDETRWYLPGEDLLGFVHIPAGKFLMGTKEKDIKGLMEKLGGEEQWYKEEIPQHIISLPEYYVARYPVTTAQFKEFAEDAKYQPQDKNSLRGVANHPVRYVTWHEAMAYCKWLTAKMQAVAPKMKSSNEFEENFWRGIESGKWSITLPSEAQWEKAARGDQDDRVFPWGDDVNLDKVNGNNVIGTTSAVGCFPQGKSPYGLLDMSGNVWEWTTTLWGKGGKLEYPYPYKIGDGRENLKADDSVARVLRGGAYDNEGSFLRCAFRYFNSPYLRNVNIGFRVVCVASPISP